jgi:HSP90 family molecular chaperone
LDTKATDEIITFLSATLSGRASKVKVTHKLESHPCVVTVEEMGAARHFVRTQSQAVPEEQRYKMLQPQLEINPKLVYNLCHHIQYLMKHCFVTKASNHHKDAQVER